MYLRINIYIYIYIYIYISLRKNKTGHIRIINLFPSCYVSFLYKPKTRRKLNRTSYKIKKYEKNLSVYVHGKKWVTEEIGSKLI